MTLDEMMSEFRELYDRLVRENARLRADNASLEAQVAEQCDEIEGLRHALAEAMAEVTP